MGKEYIYKLDKASSLDAIIAMPNLRYPIYGDSSDGGYNGNKDYSDFIDTKAGRVIFQNQWYVNSILDSFYRVLSYAPSASYNLGHHVV